MSNSSFTGVSNEDSLNRISASSADISTIRAGIINCDSVQISLPKAAVIKPDVATYNLSPENLSLLARGDVLYQDFGGTDSVFRINSVDTAAEAIRLLALFNIPNISTTRLIRLNRVNTIGASSVSIGSIGTPGTKYVQYLLAGASASLNSFQTFSTNSSAREAYILIYSGIAAGSTTDRTIVFDVIGQA